MTILAGTPCPPIILPRRKTLETLEGILLELKLCRHILVWVKGWKKSACYFFWSAPTHARGGLLYSWMHRGARTVVAGTQPKTSANLWNWYSTINHAAPTNLQTTQVADGLGVDRIAVPSCREAERWCWAKVACISSHSCSPQTAPPPAAASAAPSEWDATYRV